jgi:hypothetical protein
MGDRSQRTAGRIRVWCAMTFTIHASKNGQSVVTIRISPAVAVDKARALERSGWQVHITDSAGHQFDPTDFDRLSSLARDPRLLCRPPLTIVSAGGGPIGCEAGAESTGTVSVIDLVEIYHDKLEPGSTVMGD